MESDRKRTLLAKFERGLAKSLDVFRGLSPKDWQRPLFEEPSPWTARELVAHFVYSEEHLLRIAQDIAAGGEGAPEDLDIDAFNEEQLGDYEEKETEELLSELTAAREMTMDWLRILNDPSLDLEGRHPVLGIVSVEAVLFSIYAHQLLHMREVLPSLTGGGSGAN